MSIEQNTQYINLAERILGVEDTIKSLCEGLVFLEYEDSLITMQSIRLNKKQLHKLKNFQRELAFQYSRVK